MRRTATVASAVAVLAVMVSACGGGHKRRANGAGTTAPVSATRPVRQDAVLSLARLGTFEGRCPQDAHSWTLRFVVDTAEATETVSYRVGAGARRSVNVQPGNAITLQLVPNATRTHEPAFVPPAGQPRGLTGATSVPTTAPFEVLIYQATEPQTLRADVHLALAANYDSTGQCALVGSTVNAYAYSNAR